MDGSSYLRALNSFAETFRGVSYTNAYTAYDEVVRPPESAVLRTGEGRITNVRIQDVCPLDPSTHLMLSTADPVGFALARDALAHDGPADFARVAARGCAQAGPRGVDRSHALLQKALSRALVLPAPLHERASFNPAAGTTSAE